MSDARTAAISARAQAVAFVESLNDAAKQGVRIDFQIDFDPLSGTYTMRKFQVFEAMKLDN